MQQVKDREDFLIWLAAFAELVIPPESNEPDPDGVAAYLIVLLDSPRGQVLPLLVGHLKVGLAEVGAINFLALSPPERQASLERLVDKAAAPHRQAWCAFIEFCVEAWLSDPVRGGNRKEQGWQRVGMTGPRRPVRA